MQNDPVPTWVRLQLATVTRRAYHLWGFAQFTGQGVRMVLKSIGVLSAAKVVGVLYAVMGLLMGVVFGAFFALIPAAAAADGGDIPAWLAPMFGFGAIVFMPVVYGIMGFVGGAIAALIYNALAGVIGGLELRLESPTRA